MWKRILALLSLAVFSACPPRVTVVPSEKKTVEVLDAGPALPTYVKVQTVTGTVVDASGKPVPNAYLCDVFEADLMLGIDLVPRVIGLRSPKVAADGETTSCAKTNAQGMFSLTAPVPAVADGGVAPSGEFGFSEGKEFSVWAGSGLSRVPARADRMALGIPSYGALVRLAPSTTSTLDVGQVVLKEVKPFSVSYRLAPKSLKKAKLSFSNGKSTGFMSLDFAQAEPSWPKNGPLLVKPQGTVDVPLPIDGAYQVHLDAELMGQENAKSFEVSATHPAAAAVEFVLE